MNGDDPRWRTLPVLRELHDQWWTARGGRLGESQRPFSRDWDRLLEDAGLVSAQQRAEADRDARLLASFSLVEIKPVKYRPHFISRIVVPLAVELRFAALFGDPTTKEPAGPDLSQVEWSGELKFLRETRVAISTEDLIRLNDFFRHGGRDKAVVPIKERSLEVFGDEKRLDALLVTSPFRTGRLTLETLRCELIGEPLGWRRGPASAADQPVLAIENAATWHSYCRWNKKRALFSAVVYGKGLQVIASVQYLADIFAELGGERRVLYFGDIDPPGLLIPRQACIRAQECRLPMIEPHLWSYRRLFELGQGKETDWEGDPADTTCTEWLGELSGQARVLLSAGKRLAQEHVGWEFLDGPAANGDMEIV